MIANQRLADSLRELINALDATGVDSRVHPFVDDCRQLLFESDAGVLDDDSDSSQAAGQRLGRIPLAELDARSSAILNQLAGFAANPSIGMRHDPLELAVLAAKRADAALTECCA